VATDPSAHERGYLPLHRSEALTDGIYAVAMTLLVIELKVPEAAHLQSSAQMADALLELLPKAFAWLISFFVLAIFWTAHHRVFSHVRRADSKLVWLNLVQLAFVSLMPFSSALIGEKGVLLSQFIYSLNMTMLAITGLWIVRYVYRHHELGPEPMPRANYEGARLRIAGLILISVVAVALAAFVPLPGVGNMAFMLMAVISPISRRMEQRAIEREAGAGGADLAR
jgi:uncharacterized membrane protein